MPALYIARSGSQRDFRLWPDQEYMPPGTVTEGGEYLIELREIDDPLIPELYVDDLPVEPLRPPTRTTARWRWVPGFYAGSIDILLDFGHGRRCTIRMVADPELDKLRRFEFNRMIADILEDTTALFSLSSFRVGIGRGSGNRPPPIARLEFLRSRVSDIEEAVNAIARSPQRRLRAEELVVPYWAAPAATGPEILRSFRSARVVAEQASQSRLPGILRGFLPSRIRYDRRIASFDILEHRAIKTCLVAWSGWLTNVADLLASRIPEDPETHRIQRLWQRRCLDLARRLTKLIRLSLFHDVGSIQSPVILTPVFRNIPSYRRFYRLCSDFRLGIAAIFGDFLNVSLARTFELYEMWCFLRLARAAVERHGADPEQLAGLFGRESRSGAVTLSPGPHSIQLSSGATLFFQLTFREFWRDPSRTGSFSRRMRPDIVLTSAVGGNSEIVVLDAKYRIEGELNEALASIHMYRDAIVRDAEIGTPRRIVRAAYILAPYLPDEAPEWRNAAMPGRLFHPEYRTTFRFGALTMRPGMSVSEAANALDSLLMDALG